MCIKKPESGEGDSVFFAQGPRISVSFYAAFLLVHQQMWDIFDIVRIFFSHRITLVE